MHAAKHRPWLSSLYSLLLGLGGLGILVYQAAGNWERLEWLPIALFAGLSLLIQRSSFHLGSPITHSLAGVIDVAAVLAFGPIGGAVVAVLSGFTYLELNALRHQKLSRRYLIEIPLFNAGLKALMALLSGAVFQTLAGPTPFVRSDSVRNAQIALALGALCLLWFVLDHIGWGILESLDGGLQRLRLFIQDTIPQALLIELLPLPLGAVVALVYTHLSWLAISLTALAIVAVALLTQRWADTRHELTHRVAELTTIEQVGRTIAQAQLDVGELCQLMYQNTCQIADATIFHLGLFDGEDYISKLWIREGQARPQRTFHLAPGVGLVTWLRESKQPILVRDFEKELDSLPAQPAYVSEEPPLSALFVPLIAGETVIGTMSIQSFQRNAYGESDLRVLSAMANQAAVAIQKAQLYTQERKRVRQLETIAQVGRQVTATLELDELFRQTVYLIRENFDYYHVALFTANSEEQIVTFETGAGEQNLAFDVEWGEGLIGWVAAHGQSVIVNDVENDTRYRCLAALEGTQSELAVPLLLVLSRDVLSTPHQGRSGSEENELVGVLDVQSDQPNAFGPDDLFILETLGDQIAIAIQQARLYEAERQQAWLSTALLKIADSMSHLSDMDSVLAAIVRLTPILAGVDRCAILLWDPDLEAFVPGETHGLKPELRDTFENTWFSPDTVPALERIYDDKVPVIVNAVDDQELIPRDMAETFLIEEMALLPLLAQGELLGVMMVDYAGRPHHFGKRTTDMLTGIANQAAMVIQSARLVRAQQEEAYVSMALLQVADGINRANDLQEALETVVRITPVLAGVEACVVFLWDPDSAAFVPYEQYGLRPEAQPAFWELRFPEEHPLTQELMAGKPFIPIHDLMEHPAHPEMWGTGSLLAFPLVSKGEILGMMSIDYDIPGDQISQRWMSILTGISGQAALAIENDRLLQEAAEQERMKQELDVARRIQTSFLPERWLDIPGWELATVWRSAREVSGDFYDFIPLPPVNGAVDQRMGLVIADVADKGVPAALFMALSRTLVRTVAIDGRPPSRAIARANDLIQSDARSELFVTLFYAILQPDSEEIAFVNAGHVPPLLVRIKDGTTEELMTGDMALGVLPDLEFAGHKTHLAPGDTLVLYTDGVIEASNPQQQMFGRERLIELVKANRTQSAEELAQTIDEVVTAFAGDAPQYDDFTLVVAKRH